jgi:hypothetical protein
MGWKVLQERIKCKPKKQPRHLKRVAGLPCLQCGEAATVHHVTASIYGGRTITRTDELVVPLCPRHHQVIHGPKESVEALSHRGFWMTYGIDLENEARALWTQSIAMGLVK